MTRRLDPEVAIQAVTDILAAFLQNTAITAEELPALVRKVRAAVEADIGLGAEVQPSAGGDDAEHEPPAAGDLRAPPKPAVPVSESVHHDYIVSLEDGGRYRSLRRHLMSKYGMTPDEYRAKWHLPPTYPMVAPSYAEARSEVAKRTGLGRSPAKVKAARRST